MKDAVLVRSTLRTWDYTLLLVFGNALLAWAVVLFAIGERSPGVVVVAAGIACIFGSILGRQARVRRRRWVQDQGSGFLVIDRQGGREVKDDDVLSMALI